jgi:hypothetical protein
MSESEDYAGIPRDAHPKNDQAQESFEYAQQSKKLAYTVRRHELMGEFPKTEEYAKETDIPEGRVDHIFKLWDRGDIGYYLRGERFVSVNMAIKALRNIIFHYNENLQNKGKKEKEIR